MKYKSLRGFRLDLGPFLVARIVPRGVNLSHGSHVLFHQTDLLPQLPRHLHRFTCRHRLPKFILGFDREYGLAVSPFLADHGFPARSRPGPLIKEMAAGIVTVNAGMLTAAVMLSKLFPR